MIRQFLTAAAIVIAGLSAPAMAEPLAKDIFGRFSQPSRGPAVSIGYYSKGCAQGLTQLPETGPSWQAMRLSRNRNWGHPDLINLLIGLSQAAQKSGWKGLYIGDISQPRGGPMLSGHASHQMGLDADVWMLPPSSLNLSAAQRESLSSVSVVDKRGTGLTKYWNQGHMSIIRAAARDRRVERIFVDPVVKVAMCQMETGNRNWLRKVRPLNHHNYHFHIRMSCPKGSICQKQDAPPPGDGCAEAAEWIKNRIDPSRVKPSPPNPNYRHPRSFRLSELPQQCRTVAAAP
ncbi:penicillin-insensitive murein endopeptidase [Paracoccus seriniphilus]|uniref:Penicillin-insensitive murein endopeptidase n=1 Tax=Paracoccus seriniphilus TaxID=184748 RepID=A0A239Q095_9RHOB|nr:penicillin-insensitive murein endopeptidase [Paracoccus seriniphilus]WCR13928.1 penicillin-insensitive murein endopeptidase [Paracoccus seriniphilus]SNT75944.1 penicillin-insensitive murein endopeptidase [Paracoccus seriniphilus]